MMKGILGIVAVVLVVAAPFTAMADWTYGDISVTLADSLTIGTELTFGVSATATDTFDLGIDATAPPPPPSAPSAYFYIDHPLYTGLSVDMRSAAADSEIWMVVIQNTGSYSNIVFDWDNTTLPASGTFYVLAHYPGVEDWSTATDMRTADEVTVMPAQYVSIKYIAGGGTTDTDPPVALNWVPSDGSTDVSVSTNIEVDLLDYDSGVDTTTVHFREPSLGELVPPLVTITRTAITDGYHYVIDPVTDLSEGTTFTISVDCSDVAGNSMSDTIHFTTASTATTHYRIIGTALLEGETDHSDIAIATMTVPPYATTTASDGSYSLLVDSATTYTIIAHKDGWTDDDTTITITDTLTTGVDFFLAAPVDTLAMLSGTVTLSDVGVAAGSIVRVAGGSIDYSDTTNSAGMYLFPEVPTGTALLIVVTHEGYYGDTIYAALSGDSVIDFRLDPIPPDTYVVSGTITLEDTTDYTGIEVILSDGSTADTVTTPATGEYAFTGVEAGSYTLSASKDGYEDLDTSFSVVDTDVTIDAELALLSNPPRNLHATDGLLGGIRVTWETPLEPGETELSYDDGEVDAGAGGYNYLYYGTEGAGLAVQFTPPGTGVTLLSVKFYWWQDTTDIGTTEMHIWGEDVGTTPGDDIIPCFNVSVDDHAPDGWTIIDLPGGVPLPDGDDFWCGWQDIMIGGDLSAVAVGTDRSGADDRSWVYDGSAWAHVNDYTGLEDVDLMVRAVVSVGGRIMEIAPSGYADRLHSGYRPMDIPAVKTTISSTIENPFMPVSSPARIASPHRFLPFVYQPQRSLSFISPMDVTGYKIYRDTALFSTADPSILLATVTADSTTYIDTAMSGIDPEEMVYYGVTAIYPEGESTISNVDSGYYIEYAPPAKILIVDMDQGINFAEDTTEQEDEFIRQTLIDLGISSDDILVSNQDEGLYRFYPDTSYYDAMFIITGSYITGDPPTFTSWELYNRLYQYLDHGGKVYMEGPMLMYYYSSDSIFLEHFGVQAWPDDTSLHVIGYHLTDGNIEWLESTDDDFFSGRHLRLNYDTYTYADHYVGQIEANDEGTLLLRSQPTGTIPVLYSRGRAVYHGNAIMSLPYLGAMQDAGGYNTRERILAWILNHFGIANTGVAESNQKALPFILAKNVPNPFNPATEISFDLPDRIDVSLDIYDISGRRVRTLVNGVIDAGYNTVSWDGLDNNGNPVGSGIYLYKLTAGNESVTRRMALIR